MLGNLCGVLAAGTSAVELALLVASGANGATDGAYDGTTPTLGVVGFGGTGKRDFSLFGLLGAHARNATAPS